MSKHTSGPWIVNDFCALNEADVMIWSGPDIHSAKPIAECVFVTQAEIDSGETGCHQLEAEANARLIAAAPEMLEALREVAENTTSLELRSKVYAAINKATGAA